jgi:polyferredoxin
MNPLRVNVHFLTASEKLESVPNTGEGSLGIPLTLVFLFLFLCLLSGVVFFLVWTKHKLSSFNSIQILSEAPLILFFFFVFLCFLFQGLCFTLFGDKDLQTIT